MTTTATDGPPDAATEARGVDLDELRALVGRSSPFNSARDPVNEPMIRHWCDVLGEENPVYTDAGAAAASAFGGIVAPPAMLDVWDKPGLPQRRDPDNPQSAALTVLDHHGFTSTVAVNSELEFARFLRPGELVHSTLTLEDVSDEKHTGLGVGHFVTSRIRYLVGDEMVGSVLFRVLKFRPGTGRPADPAPERAAARDPDPAKRPRPAINRDNQYFWDGARDHELRIQTCNRCGAKFFPPTPRCSECGGFDMGFTVASGRATLYSFAVPHHPQADGFRYPVLVGLVELEEGTRLVSNIVGCTREHLSVGMPLEVCWLDSHPALVDGADDSRGPISLPQFRPARVPRRETTRAVADVEVGEPLPLDAIPLTTTLIVGGALMTRDYFDGHHDRDMAVRRGSKDVFMNIHTTLGLVERYISDWAGPEAVWRALRVRLGAPNYPYDTMTMSGRVDAVDTASGAVTIAFRGTNQLGDHVSGTAELLLPGGRAYAEAVGAR
ncbi:MAG TPA: OB-fold domain-containing protein [Acidimicrobiia bacterium]|nr:OB-fold domain-containing protein [Acidimicrobiia bacterium]